MEKDAPTPEIEQLLRQAESRLDRKDISGALKMYNKVLDLKPGDSWTLWEKAMARKLGGDYQGAIKDLTVAIEADPENSFAWAQRGILKEKTGDKKGAEADYEKVRQLRELNPPEKRISQRPKMDTSHRSSREKDGRSAQDYVVSSSAQAS